MNKYLLFIIPFLFLNTLTSQVLYTENFDNFTLGDLGNDVTGQTPGQGNWYTTGATNAQYAIITEPNKGKVLSLFTNNPQQDQYLNVEKRNLITLIDQRTSGNNVIKIEVDFYTSLRSTADNSVGSGIGFVFDPPKNYTSSGGTLMNFVFSYAVGHFNVLGFDGKFKKILTNNFLNFDSWYQLVFYLDYTNKKCYFEMLGTNITGNSDFLTYVNPADFKLSAISLSVQFTDLEGAIKRENRFDNFKITALKAVPPHLLSTDNFLAQKFNLYPNPATNIVNITNSENRLVNQVEIYDVTGKLINTQKFNKEAEIHLNVENLVSGSYLLYLQTDQGIAVKKLIKK